MPHGDFSDYAAFFCMGTGGASLFAPHLWFTGVGPLSPLLDGMGDATAQGVTLIRFIGALLLMIGFSLFVVRWNTVNGKAGGLGAFVASGTAAYTALSHDGGLGHHTFWHVFTVMFLLAGLHLWFRANPMWTPETLAAKIEERKARKAAKNK